MKRTVCITFRGHEDYTDSFDEEDPFSIKLILRLAREVAYCIKAGYTTFICVLGSLPELWFAEVVLDFIHAYPKVSIRLCVIRCPVNHYLSRADYLIRYEQVLSQAEVLDISATEQSDGFFKEAEKHMRERSSYKLNLAHTRPALKDANKTEVNIDLREFHPKQPPMLSILK